NEADVAVESNAGNTRDQTCGIPLKIKNNSHQGLLNTPTPQTNSSKLIGDLDMMFIFDSDRDRVFDFDIKGTLDAYVQQHENIEWAYYRICITTYQNGFDFDLKERIVLTNLSDIQPLFGIDYDGDISPYTVPNVPFSYQNAAFPVLEGESVALEVILEADMYFNNNAGCRVFAQNISLDYDFILNEDSVYPSSWSKVVLSHDIVNKIVSVITGKEGVFRSTALGTQALGYAEDGIAAFTGFAHGFWIRGFQQEPIEDDNKYKGLTTSLKEINEFLSVTWGLALGIERIGFKESVVIEKLSHFFNANVTIKLPFQIQNVKRKVAKEYYYSGVEVGYSKGGEYEEAVGLDEYNASSTFTTVITRIIKIYKKISKIRADMYGAEFARRKPEVDYKTEDTSYDKDVFAFDMKPKGPPNEYEMRKWQDDFSQEPTGVYNPDTATNLRFTPFNVLFYKHGWEIAASFITYASDFLRYASSTANSALKTKFIGGDEYAENGDVENSKFEKARFEPEWIEFEHVVDHELLKTVEGSTVILGKEVLNFYGLVQFTNEVGDQEYGYLFNLKPNKKGKWKLLKANNQFVVSSQDQLTFSSGLIMDGHFTIRLGGEGFIDWGDGSEQTTFSGESELYTHFYSGFNGTIKFFGNLTRLHNTTVGSNLYHNIISLPSEMEHYDNEAINTTSGNLQDLKEGLRSYLNLGLNTVAGDLADLPSTIQTFINIGNNTVFGNISNIPSISEILFYRCEGNNTVNSYTNGTTFNSGIFLFNHLPSVGNGLDSVEIDNILIDLQSSGMNLGSINISGNNASRTIASDAAVAALELAGVVVTVNT
ncbi:MAG: hypothetical protein KUG67_03225, partial [Proteobacteria bacterium]|nr:hypothetical protein [Pseudomonadota bacterium]